MRRKGVCATGGLGNLEFGWRKLLELAADQRGQKRKRRRTGKGLCFMRGAYQGVRWRERRTVWVRVGAGRGLQAGGKKGEEEESRLHGGRRIQECE